MGLFEKREQKTEFTNKNLLHSSNSLTLPTRRREKIRRRVLHVRSMYAEKVERIQCIE
jgi:hypothetical protein